MSVTSAVVERLINDYLDAQHYFGTYPDRAAYVAELVGAGMTDAVVSGVREAFATMDAEDRRYAARNAAPAVTPIRVETQYLTPGDVVSVHGDPFSVVESASRADGWWWVRVSGRTSSYRLTRIEEVELIENAPHPTRVTVYRPADGQSYTGTVIGIARDRDPIVWLDDETISAPHNPRFFPRHLVTPIP